MPLRVEDCPNCGHRPSDHAALAAERERFCDGRDGTLPCACPLDRAAVGIAIGVAAAMVKYG